MEQKIQHSAPRKVKREAFPLVKGSAPWGQKLEFTGGGVRLHLLGKLGRKTHQPFNFLEESLSSLLRGKRRAWRKRKTKRRKGMSQSV